MNTNKKSRQTYLQSLPVTMLEGEKTDGTITLEREQAERKSWRVMRDELKRKARPRRDPIGDGTTPAYLHIGWSNNPRNTK